MRVRVPKRAATSSGLFCFSMVYNEEWFLPHFLAHHRALGVERFIFFNDGSTDRTREILMAQDDCVVLEATHVDEPRPRLAEMQRIIGNFVLENFGKDEWGLTLDADEFVILPTQFATLHEFTRYLDERGFSCALAAMVDFYPPTLAERFYDPLPPLVGSRWFDRTPGFRRVAGKLPKMVFAGVRARLLEMLSRKYTSKVREIYGDRIYRVAKLWKIPLVKTAAGVRRVDPHNVSAVPPEDVQFALAHMKFYPGLDGRVDEALSRKGHYLGSLEYTFLKAVVELLPDEPLICSRTVEYQSPADLERVGLIFAK